MRFDPMHISDLIKLIVSVASFVTVCVTLFFLVLQNRTIVMQTKFNLQSVESNVFSTMTNQSLASDDVFLRYPELRPYFYSGKALVENDPLADKVKSAAEYYLDYFESLTTQLKKYPNLWRSEKNAWEANIIDMFAWSPVLCQYLEVNKEWYDEELMGLKKARGSQATTRLCQTALLRARGCRAPQVFRAQARNAERALPAIPF